jgi:Tfp pilus assembly protein PilF
MSASESNRSAPEKTPVHPLDGGVWRPVAPEELFRRGDRGDGARDQLHDDAPKPNSKVTIQRRQHLEHYLRDRPADIESYLELAAIYRSEGRAVEATRTLKAALEIEPDHGSVLWELEEAELARSLQQLRDVRGVAERLSSPEAERELERAKTDWTNRREKVCRARLARDPANHHLRVVLAEALREQGRSAEAIEALKLALQCDTEAPLAYLILGNCKYAEGDVLGALSAWRHAAMRRSLAASPKIRSTALKAAIGAASSLGLTASLAIYQQALKSIDDPTQTVDDQVAN